MTTRPLTRRHFLVGCAATGAAAVAVGLDAVPAFAEGGQIGVDARPESQQVHTLCQGCPHQCGYTAYVVEGNLTKTLGDAANPHAVGKLCTRGYGYTQSAFSDANVKTPLRRCADGSFENISWDEAFTDIAERLDAIIDESGAGSVGLIYDGASSVGAAYGPYFMHAIGSANAYVDDVTWNVNKEAAFTQVIGASSFYADFEHASLILLVDTSYADVATPSLSAALQTARQGGVPIIALDARLGDVASFADSWVAVNPGTELALLLAVCNYLIANDLYDKQFVAANASGFDAWADSLVECTAKWAADITGVEAYEIEKLAVRLHDAAPRVAIEYGNGSIGLGAFSNSSETARIICLLLMLLGAWNVPGGAYLPFDTDSFSFRSVVEADVDEKKLAQAPSLATYPLGRPFGASAANALRMTGSEALRALFAVEADVVYDYASLSGLDQNLKNMDLFVCISQQMTETAQLADFILPTCSFLQSASLPVFPQGNTPSVAMAFPVLAIEDTTALPLSQIFEGLAACCGLEEAFGFSQEQAARMQLRQAGIELDGMQAIGTTELPLTVKRMRAWPTPTGKIQCLSQACLDAGLPPSPVWVPPLGESNIESVLVLDENLGTDDVTEVLKSGLKTGPRFHLISGQQTVLGSAGYNTEELTDIAHQYQLDGLWINAQIAQALGIESGDEVFITNEKASAKVTAFVTNRIAPTAVYLPSGFGHVSSRQSNGFQFGTNPTRFSDPILEGGYGTLCTQEACVWLRKEGE